MKSNFTLLAARWLAALICGCSVALAADEPASPTPAQSKPAEKTTGTTASTASSRNDQLVLDATLVTGNRELPKVMYIVPWKKAELGDLPGQPFNTLVDETLAPVDRDVFRREVEYYQVIADKDNAAGNRTGMQATPVADTK